MKECYICGVNTHGTIKTMDGDMCHRCSDEFSMQALVSTNYDAVLERTKQNRAAQILEESLMPEPCCVLAVKFQEFSEEEIMEAQTMDDFNAPIFRCLACNRWCNINLYRKIVQECLEESLLDEEI